MTIGNKFPIFHYETSDFNIIVKNDGGESKFDKILKVKWVEGMKNNVFRYKLNIKECKWLEGKYKFYVQLNLDRGKNRRTPEDIQSITVPFDENRFNFTKINDKEIYFDIVDGDGNNVIAANVSPVEYGHCIFLPDRLKCLPQAATKFSVLKIIELLLLTKSPHIRAIFNSLCAHASVNHLHWHLYYLNVSMLLEDHPLECLFEPIYMIKDYPGKGFCIKLSSFLDNDVLKFSSIVYSFIKYLQKQLIAHNVYITRAKISPASVNHDDVRAYIWARESSIGVKDTLGFFTAVNELFGHLSLKTEESYNTLNEETIAQCLEEVTNNKFKFVKERLKESDLID